MRWTPLVSADYAVKWIAPSTECATELRLVRTGVSCGVAPVPEPAALLSGRAGASWNVLETALDPGVSLY